MWSNLRNDLCKVEDFKEFRRLVNTWSGYSCICSISKSWSVLFCFFNLAPAYINFYFFYPSLLFTCSALLCLAFILPFISSLLCFYKFLI